MSLFKENIRIYFRKLNIEYILSLNGNQIRPVKIFLIKQDKFDISNILYLHVFLNK